MNQIIPSKVVMRGNKKACEAWAGFADLQLGYLNRSMSFQNLSQGIRRFRPEKGVEIRCMKMFGVSTVEIFVQYTPEDIEKGLVETEVIDLRFFVRVGASTDVNSDVTLDTTRFLWVDFGKISGTDAIRIYPVGKTSSIIYRESTAVARLTPDVSREIMHSVVNIPGAHTQTKSFYLYASDSGVVAGGTDEEKALKQKRRFAAGYHFLVEHEFSEHARTMRKEDITATVSDGDEINRFYVNTDDGTLCWYRCLQTWNGSSSPSTVDASGEIAGVMYKVDYETNAEGELVWTYPNDSVSATFTINPSDLSLAGATSDVGSVETEPACLLSEVLDISNSELTVNMAYQSQPYTVTSPLNVRAGTFGGISIATASELSRNKFSSAGFTASVKYEYSYIGAGSTRTSDDWIEITSMESYCAEATNETDCNTKGYSTFGGPYHIELYEWERYSKNQFAPEISISLAMGGDTYQYRDTSGLHVYSTARARNNYDACNWSPLASGGPSVCNAHAEDTGNYVYQTRTWGQHNYMHGYMSSAWKNCPNTRGDFSTPGNNIDHINDSYTLGAGNVTREFFSSWNKNIFEYCPDLVFSSNPLSVPYPNITLAYPDHFDGCYEAVKDIDCVAHVPDNYAEFIEMAIRTPGASCNDGDPDTTSPTYQFEYSVAGLSENGPDLTDEYCGLDLENFPYTLTDPASVTDYPDDPSKSIIHGVRYISDDTFSDAGTTTSVDQYTINDDLTYSGTLVDSIRYLDDRSSDDSHGLCIAIKGTSFGEWVIIEHGEDGVTTTRGDKYAELLTALIDSGNLDTSLGEKIIDTGLV